MLEELHPTGRAHSMTCYDPIINAFEQNVNLTGIGADASPTQRGRSPNVTSISTSSPSRNTVSVIACPGRVSSTR